MTVSIIIAAYNAEAYLAAAIESCLTQTCPPHEIIVIDDGSTDSTATVAADFGPRIKLIRAEKNAGVAASRNLGIAAASGDWLAFLDADDWFLPRKLELQMEAAEAGLSLLMIYGDFVERDVDGMERTVQAHEPELLRNYLEYGCAVAICTVVVRRETMLLLGGFDPSLQGTEDWEMWRRIVQRYPSSVLARIGTPLAVYRRTPGSLSSRNRTMLRSRLSIVDHPDTGASRPFGGWLARNRVRSFIYYDAALALRHDDAPDYLQMMLRSLIEWPFPCLVMGLRRYKVAFVMTLQRLLGWHTPHPRLPWPPVT